MATKTTSSKTAASARSTPKKATGNLPKAAKTATAAQGEKSATAKRVTKKTSEQGEVAAKVAKPAEGKAKVAPRRRKSAAAPERKAAAEAVAAPLEVVPPAPARPSREEIAARAAALWRQHGGPAFDNWIRAERELGA